ncbi:NRDE family protein [Reinekea marinisedimentorum]|uniref:Uncharacterized protein with NRDE domain n=1 Tax=Reinekea marinisedimentorum TaxID=230495 RepID=A0A4V2UJJ3_9GAMM|nr:NRDE family protein [Reinekea marinisedimentorum]TCS40102.1 uncharacterized protein with NRDE domain [Reinekea marinisedimentorum]
MCLAVIAWQPNTSAPLTVVANRDEFRQRPTAPMHWWADADILAGKDLQAGGTWLGFNRSGLFALLTNIRPGFVGHQAAKSRGNLIRKFLLENQPIEHFHQSLMLDIELYGGFNLLLGDMERLFWFSSTMPEGQWLEPGVYGLSNDSLDTPWPKTELAKEQMRRFLASQSAPLLHSDILTSSAPADEGRLPQTGVPLEWERLISAQTITNEQYGTRCRTYIQSQNGLFNITEQQLTDGGEVSSSCEFQLPY